MTWHYAATPDQVQSELGPDMLDGDYAAANPDWALAAGTWSREGGGRFALTVGDPYTYLTLTPDAVYTITVEVRGAEAASWEMALQNSAGEQITLPVGDADTIPADDWVTVRANWRAPLDPLAGSPALTVAGPGTVEIRNPVMAVQTGRVILTVPGDVLAERIMASGGIVAGTPGGARVELTEDGLLAFDATNAETARIQGEGGEFVGGEFRTSDALPGQVRLADDAYINSTTGVAHPGIRVEPLDTSTMARPPGIGPGDLGLYVDGGSDTSGRRSYLRTSPTALVMRTFREDGTVGGAIQTTSTESLMHTDREDGTKGGAIQTSPGQSLMRTYRADGTVGGEIQTAPDASRIRTYSGNSSESGWVRARPQDAELAYVDPSNVYASRILTNASEASLYTRAGGTSRYLTVDANGVWVKTDRSGSWESWNLEETANDTGWQAITPEAGITGAGSPGWRNKGGVVWLRGQLTRTSGSWAAGWTTLCTLPAQARPATALRRPAAIPGTGGAVLQVGAAGGVQVYLPETLIGAAEMHLGELFFPLG